MKALTFHGDHNIQYTSIPDPVIEHPTDVLVKVKLCAICGSDLHVYHGVEKGCDHSTAMGHEFAGEIVETGNQVTQLKTGDLVMSPFSTNCGQCANCKKGLTSRCTHSQLFGWRQDKKGLQGGQAEYIRVPWAEHTLLTIPETLSLEHALLLGDVIPTGYFCAYQAEIKPEGIYAVIGCGAVGLMAILGAFEQGATTVYAIDTLPERLELAASFGAIPINASTQKPADFITEKTHGYGVDSVLEAVGGNSSLRLAYTLVRPGGIISMVGVNNEPALPFSPMDAYTKNGFNFFLLIKFSQHLIKMEFGKILPIIN